MICRLDFGMPAVLLSEWILVDGSGPKRTTGKRPDTYRRQGSPEDPDAVPRLDPGPARARRVRHQRDRRIGAHLSDEHLARRRGAVLESAGEPSVGRQVPR